MSQHLFTSDPDLIIDLLLNSMLLGHYMGLYRRPYTIEKGKEILAGEGIEANETEVAQIIELFKKHKISDQELVPDIVLFLQVITDTYKDETKNNIPKYWIESRFIFDEIIKLKELVNNTKYNSQKDKIQIIIKHKKSSGIKKYFFNSTEVISHTIKSYEKFLDSNEAKLALYIAEDKERKSILLNHLLQHKENTPRKDNIKIQTIKKSINLFTLYFYNNHLFNLDEANKSLPNPAAYFIGDVLSKMGLLPSEAEFDEKIELHSQYETYREFLIQRVKSYCTTRRKQ